MKINYKVVYKNKPMQGSFSTNIITRINATQNKIVDLVRGWMQRHVYDFSTIVVGKIELVVQDRDAVAEFSRVGVFDLDHDIDLVFKEEVPA